MRYVRGKIAQSNLSGKNYCTKSPPFKLYLHAYIMIKHLVYKSTTNLCVTSYLHMVTYSVAKTNKYHKLFIVSDQFPNFMCFTHQL